MQHTLYAKVLNINDPGNGQKFEQAIKMSIYSVIKEMAMDTRSPNSVST